MNKSKSSLFIFYPNRCSIGIPEQSVYSLHSDMEERLIGGFEEVFPSGKDKSIVMRLQTAEYSLEQDDFSHCKRKSYEDKQPQGLDLQKNPGI